HPFRFAIVLAKCINHPVDRRRSKAAEVGAGRLDAGIPLAAGAEGKVILIAVAEHEPLADLFHMFALDRHVEDIPTATKVAHRKPALLRERGSEVRVLDTKN